MKVRHAGKSVNPRSTCERAATKDRPKNPHNRETAVLVTLCPGGKGQRQVDIRDIEIPDLYDLAMWVRRHEPREGDGELIRQLWSLTHDLKRHIETSNGNRR